MYKKLAITLLSVAATGVAVADTVRVQTTDFSGKPPFKRKFETVEVKDVAQFERVDSAKAEMVTVQTTDFSGKPPFKRNVETLEVRDVAEFSEIQDADAKQVRSTSVNKKAPFKRHR